MRKSLCPRDGTALTPSEKHAVEFYLCRKCYGMWFRRTDLENLAAQIATAPDKLWALRWEKSFSRTTTIEGSARCICPQSPLMEVVEVDGVNIDVCPSCSGVWLDGGEIRKLVGHDESRDRRAFLFRLLKEALSWFTGGTSWLVFPRE